MSNNKDERDEEFWKMTDAFIKLANEQCETSRNGKVSTTLLFAAARFNAFMFASMSENLEAFKKDRDMAVTYFSNQYHQAFIENLNDYEKNYSDYVGKKQ